MVVAQEDFQATKILLDAVADANRQTTLGMTALYFAASDDNFEIVQLLISRGANREIASFGGQRPRYVAGSRTRRLLV